MGLVGKIVSLLFNMLSRYCHGFSSKEQVSFNSMAAVAICSDFGAKKIKSVTVSIVSPTTLPWSDGRGTIFIFFFFLKISSLFWYKKINPSMYKECYLFSYCCKANLQDRNICYEFKRCHTLEEKSLLLGFSKHQGRGTIFSVSWFFHNFTKSSLGKLVVGMLQNYARIW